MEQPTHLRPRSQSQQGFARGVVLWFCKFISVTDASTLIAKTGFLNRLQALMASLMLTKAQFG